MSLRSKLGFMRRSPSSEELTGTRTTASERNAAVSPLFKPSQSSHPAPARISEAEKQARLEDWRARKAAQQQEMEAVRQEAAELERRQYRSAVGTLQYFSAASGAAKRRSAIRKRKDSALRIGAEITAKYMPQLLAKYRASHACDDYGRENIDTKKWADDKRYFVTSVMADRLPHEDIREFFDDLSAELDAAVEKANSEDSSLAQVDRLSGYEFETHCAEILRKQGWIAAPTQKSGDQGVDVIATKGHIVAAIQCKLYKTKKVGNDAVQQINAGREFVRANRAVVVATIDYTQSARELAAKTGVHLLQLSQLQSLYEILSEELPR